MSARGRENQKPPRPAPRTASPLGKGERARGSGGIIHSYQGYDPKRFPSPTQPAPDVAGAAMEHMLMFGTSRPMSAEELAEAIEIDPSQIAGLGPSLDALVAMLEERKRKILETYDPTTALGDALRRYQDAASDLEPSGPRAKQTREKIDKALRAESIPELERLWYKADWGDKGLARRLMRTIDALGTKYEVEELNNRWVFTGRTPLDADEAVAVKEELEAIEDLLEQLREAMKNAKVAKIDPDKLAEFVDEAGVEQLREIGEKVADYLREQAELQGLEAEKGGEGYRLTPKAVRLFQSRLLEAIFSDLQSARSGRHTGPIEGDGAVELPRTRGYAFGDSVAHLDVPQTLVNAVVRTAVREAKQGGDGVRVRGEDIEVHTTRNTPKAATSVIVDMSGSMRHGGQYIACKKMALALDGLIRGEYPGDHLSLIEMYTFAKVRTAGEIAGLMPKPVTIRDPWVRLKVDMSDPEVSEVMVPPHFTNIQRSLQLARTILGAQDTPNRQVFLITDGLPTAHYEGDELFMLYPPDPLTERATMREAAACAREGITINIFLVPSWSQSSEDIAFAHRLAETTRGRMIVTGGHDLDRFVVWDYIRGRRSVIA